MGSPETVTEACVTNSPHPRDNSLGGDKTNEWEIKCFVITSALLPGVVV